MGVSECMLYLYQVFVGPHAHAQLLPMFFVSHGRSWAAGSSKCGDWYSFKKPKRPVVSVRGIKTRRRGIRTHTGDSARQAC